MKPNKKPSDHSPLIKNIKHLMQQKGWSGADLATQSGQKLSDIYNILSGKSKKPSADKIDGIARAFGVSIPKILYNQNDRKDSSQDNVTTSVPNLSVDETFDGVLYTDAMNLVRRIFEKYDIKFVSKSEERQKAVKYACRVYNYARKRGEVTPDAIYVEDIVKSEFGA